MKNEIQNELDGHIQSINHLSEITDEIANASQLCIDILNSGGKILLFGNGGSAADAQHIAAELVGRFKLKRKGLPAIALTTDTSALTSIGNDFGFNHIFDRQIEALAVDKDVVIGISTSGNSQNVINALQVASNLSCKTIGLTGINGGIMNEICDIAIKVPSNNTPRIQEMHILVGHIICHLIDQNFTIL
ncbi:D-sedoheptulose 7-phosphate isomerase [Pseudothioglobus sp. nBUS_23]|uniref:D-sedoheptulose 7-phosphate isomerase n=1 Tax=Pseudothioglobus sp. nBUS_23 TaxID=3395318 RepID=UPI003EBA0BB6